VMNRLSSVTDFGIPSLGRISLELVKNYPREETKARIIGQIQPRATSWGTLS
jgi:hypothetical protein